MLNAFRHLRYLHLASMSRSCQVQHVLNAFRHLRYLHPFQSGVGVSVIRVLNAFRHLRYLHLPRIASTTWESSCAQRLSASEVSAQRLKGGAEAAAISCSTPFGI